MSKLIVSHHFLVFAAFRDRALIGHFLATNHRQQGDAAPKNGRIVKHLHRHVVDVGMLVPNAPVLSSMEPGLRHLLPSFTGCVASVVDGAPGRAGVFNFGKCALCCEIKIKITTGLCASKALLQHILFFYIVTRFK